MKKVATDSGNTYVYRFGDRITIENADRLLAEIESRTVNPSISRIVFDLENVIECNSYGLRLLIVFLRKAEAAGRSLVLYRPSAALRDLFMTTQLNSVFDITDTINIGGAE